MKAIDLMGQKFGELTVIESLGVINRNSRFICLCSCGNEINVRVDSLKRGESTRCGECNKRKMIGKRFGKLLVVEFGGSVKCKGGTRLKFKCICDCGGEIETRNDYLTNGLTKSCGCSQLIDYDGYRFRSLWEVWFYIAAKSKGLDILYR